MYAVLITLLAAAPAQATFDEENGSSELEMQCAAEGKGKVRCRFLQAQVDEAQGACVFRTSRFSYDFDEKGSSWVHVGPTPCETTVTVELTAKSTSSGLAWTYTQTRTGTSVDSEFCRASTANRALKFVPGGGKKRSTKCTSVTMSLG